MTITGSSLCELFLRLLPCKLRKYLEDRTTVRKTVLCDQSCATKKRLKTKRRYKGVSKCAVGINRRLPLNCIQLGQRLRRYLSVLTRSFVLSFGRSTAIATIRDRFMARRSSRILAARDNNELLATHSEHLQPVQSNDVERDMRDPRCDFTHSRS